MGNKDTIGPSPNDLIVGVPGYMDIRRRQASMVMSESFGMTRFRKSLIDDLAVDALEESAGILSLFVFVGAFKEDSAVVTLSPSLKVRRKSRAQYRPASCTRVPMRLRPRLDAIDPEKKFSYSALMEAAYTILIRRLRNATRTRIIAAGSASVNKSKHHISFIPWFPKAVGPRARRPRGEASGVSDAYRARRPWGACDIP